MTAVFADTFYWIAVTNARDSAHEEAKRLSRSLASVTLVTTEPVLIEYLNYFAAWGSELRGIASANANTMLSNPSVRVLPLTARSLRAGIDLYAARLDKGYSLTDCISMAAMRDEGLTGVLTHDRHFEQEGFLPLLRAD